MTMLEEGRALQHQPISDMHWKQQNRMHKCLHVKDIDAFVTENAYSMCFQKLTHQMHYWHKRKFNCKSERVLPCLLEERPKQLSLLFFFSSIKSANVTPWC